MRANYNYLEFTQITSNDQGRYYCTATSPFGNATKVAEVIVHHHEVPHRNQPQVDRVMEAIEGDTLSLECEPSSDGVRVSSTLRGILCFSNSCGNRMKYRVFSAISLLNSVFIHF